MIGLKVAHVQIAELIDRKRARKLGEAWDDYAQSTSSLPFAAIASGRNHLALGEIALWQWIAAVVGWAVLWINHDEWFL